MTGSHTSKEVSEGVKTKIKSKYNIEATLVGEGKYSKIFLASLKSDPTQKVAIRCIAKVKADGEIQNIIDDVERLKDISHPNIIKYYEMYEDTRTLFIVMEYCKGEALFDAICKRAENNGTFTEYEAAEILKKILSAVEYCHSKNIVHKDIKPKKIMITDEGDIKLIDFGLSKWKSAGGIHVTSGSPYYIAPELIKGHKTTKSDIWSLGVILYSLLSGTLPFVKDEEESIFDKAMSGKFTFEGKIWHDVSDSAKELIQKMILLDYRERYSATDGLAHEWLGSALSSENMPEEDNYFRKSTSENFMAFRTRNQLQISVAQIMNQCLDAKDYSSFRQKLETIADSEHNVDSTMFGTTMANVNTKINDEKLKELSKSIEQYQSGSRVFNYKPIMEEYQHQIDFKLNSQFWMVYYQFYDESLDLLDGSHLGEIFEQFQKPKTQKEINKIIGNSKLIMKTGDETKYNIKST